jgi:hypothetical protein
MLVAREPARPDGCTDHVKARLVAGALLASATLVWTASAHAKELAAFKVCGPSGCTSVADQTLLANLIRGVEAQGDAVRVGTPPPAPFLRLEYWVRGDLARGPSFVQYYVPSRGALALMSGPQAWIWVRPGTVKAVFDRVTGATAPFAAPRISAVAISGKTVRDPGSYARLFTLTGKAERFPDEPDWQQIVITTAAPGPWSTSAATLEYSKSTDVLWRGSEFVKVTRAVASRIEARRSLTGSTGPSFPWRLLFGGLGGAALIVPTAVFFRRRRIH